MFEGCASLLNSPLSFSPHADAATPPCCQVVKKYRQAKENSTVGELFKDLYPLRHNSGTKCSLTVGIARALHRINLEHSGGLSYAQLRDKLQQEGYGYYEESTVARWFHKLGVKTVKLYLRSVARYKFAISHRLDFTPPLHIHRVN